MAVVYVKLTSGEDVVAKLKADTTDGLTLSDPLALESGVDETDPSRRYVYMSRFSPYADGVTVTLRQTAVAMVMPASMQLCRYYEASLRYCKKFSDTQFDEGIAATTDCLEQAIADEPKSEPTETETEVRSVSEVRGSGEIWAALMMPTSNTCH